MSLEQRDNLLGAHAALTARVAELEAERDKLRLANGELALYNAEVLDENAALRKAFNEAPHAANCGLNECSKCEGDSAVCAFAYEDCQEREGNACDCWKSRIPVSA
jgi:hypothetical protein